MVGFDVSERTVSRWMRRAPRDPEPAKRWLSFLRNHREAIAAMDFFTVPTITCSVLYSFLIISHDRRRILHFNVTRHPTSVWIIQQLREAFPYQSARLLVLSLLHFLLHRNRQDWGKLNGWNDRHQSRRQFRVVTVPGLRPQSQQCGKTYQDIAGLTRL